jgi:hypothetical protein
MKNTFTLDIVRCVRCNKNHTRLVFKAFKNTISQYTHWALCPVTGEPILTGYPTPLDAHLVRKMESEGRTCKLSKLAKKA